MSRFTPMDVAVPSGWDRVPAWKVMTPLKRLGHASEEVLSVYRDYGVIPKSSRDDNHNRTPENLDSYQLVEPGDVVFNKMKAWSGSVGVSAHRGIVSGDYLVCAKSEHEVETRYLHYLLRSRPFFEEYAKRSTGIRPSQWRLYWEELSQLDLPLPSLDTQRAIADFLDLERERIVRADTSLRRSLKLSEERFRAAVTATLVGSRTQQALGLEGAPVQLLARTGSGHTPSRSVEAYWTDCYIPWVTTADVNRLRRDEVEVLDDTEHKVSDAGIANSSARLHPKGTVFLSRTASVGFSGIMGSDMATSQDFFTWTCGSSLEPRFLLWTLRVMRWSGVFDRLMHGTTHKTIYVPDLMPLRVPIPDRETQVRCARLAGEMNESRLAFAKKVNMELALLREREQALVTAAITGQITV